MLLLFDLRTKCKDLKGGGGLLTSEVAEVPKGSSLSKNSLKTSTKRQRMTTTVTVLNPRLLIYQYDVPRQFVATPLDKPRSRRKKNFSVVRLFVLTCISKNIPLTNLNKMSAQIVDKHGNPIHEGDYVFTRIRGGSHEGKVRRTRQLILRSSSRQSRIYHHLGHVIH
jgi:hypothetical protein